MQRVKPDRAIAAENEVYQCCALRLRSGYGQRSAREGPKKDVLKKAKFVSSTSILKMENLNTYINELTGKVDKLARTQNKLQSENVDLKSRNDELEQLVTQQKNALTELEEQNKVVKIAKAVTEDDDDRKEQRKRLNELVREIDKCIALLNN